MHKPVSYIERNSSLKFAGLLAQNLFTTQTFLSADAASWHVNTEASATSSPDIHIMYSVMPLGAFDLPLGLMNYVYDFLNINQSAVSCYLFIQLFIHS